METDRGELGKTFPVPADITVKSNASERWDTHLICHSTIRARKAQGWSAKSCSIPLKPNEEGWQIWMEISVATSKIAL